MQLIISKSVDYIKGMWRGVRSEEEGVVGIWDTITKILINISILQVIISIWLKVIDSQEEELKARSKERLYKFIEKWVSCHTFLAIGASFIIFYGLNKENRVWIFTICIYGCWRVFEIIIKQIRVVLFDTLGKKSGKIKSARRSIILLIHNIIEMIFWFACTFMGVILVNLESDVYLSEVYKWQDFIKCSTLQMLVFGDNYTIFKEIVPNQSLLLDITFWEVVIGFIVIALARLFSLLPTEITLENEILEEKINE